ncbi:hypothetical protein GXP67_23815 [Rhodocytophaga rosea]|uniref:Toxin-antitoxin system YwqK family antitoxin n=1 Tax=Rhodocytophaga rosea TaxID=2704465 RepID=A0A6C0GPE2_9BACT|nr:hypothetical protein [Rhodocytophaga rosea]QHT69452.1 hypothetical protein GXP67_23815 [Rhodocytophaga rosea]
MNTIKNTLLVVILINLISCSKEREYYKNGNIKAEVPTIKGVRHGLLTTYYENGKIKEKFPYKLGKMEGEAIRYDSIGNIIDRVNFVNNQYNGPFYKYYHNGVRELEGYFKNGKSEGLSYQYYKSGKLHKVYYHQQGEVIYLKTYHENGVFMGSKLPISVIPKDIKEFYPLNEEHKVTIGLNYTHLKNTRITLYFGPLDNENQLIDTIIVAKSQDLSFRYKVKPTHIGLNDITGVLYELTVPGDTLVGNYFFKYQYTVQDQ